MRAGKTLGELEDWRAKNLQCRVVEVDFSLDTRGPNGAKVLGRSERIFEKRRLADAGVAVHDQHRTFATSRRGQHLIEHCLLATPADQPPNGAQSLHHAGNVRENVGETFPTHQRRWESGQQSVFGW